MLIRSLLAIACVPGFCLLGRAADAPSYNRDIRPILSDKCLSCHGFDPKHRKADLRLDTAEGAYGKNADGLAFIVPGAPDKSEVWKRILSQDPKEMMPPPESHKTLNPQEKELIRQWIQAGAKYEKHWAFTAPVRPTVPNNGEANPIDAILTDALKAKGLKRSAEAAKEDLLRRVTLDLTGLPPSLQEIDAFLADTAPGAYERVVDRLLSSPRYGERMASPWMDIARYSDTNGYLHDNLRTTWPWRDWVIKAFNDDLPYDQFVIQQLAGDLLPNATPEQVLATTFNRNHAITTEGGSIAAEYLNEYAADRAQTAGTAFLGLTMNCCRCHDHKFDPIKQEDFYSLESYFNSITEKHVENNSAPAFEPLIETTSPLLPDGPKVKVMVMKEAAQPTPTYVLTRGQYDQPDKNHPVVRRPPPVLGEPLKDAPVNRLGLAQWLVSPQDPMLARVTVNRVWQQFFNTGLVKSVDDFGLQGDYPSHPELLDWLAVSFREGSGAEPKPWSMRQLVRGIVTSAAYKQSSHVREEALAKDPENRLLSFFPRRRLTAEEVRDQALFASNLLSGELGGPPVYPYQPPGMWEERANEGSNTKKYVRSTGSALYRRSLYTFWKRTAPPPSLTVFDAPERVACSARRMPTNTPLQALAVLNDEQTLECAKHLAARVMKEATSTQDRLVLMYRYATSRKPAAADVKTLQAGLDDLLARFRSAPADAKDLLQQGVTPTDPALDQQELAAWMLMASTVLNLDQTLMRD